MTDVERYEKKLKGKRFIIPSFDNSIIYTLGDCYNEKYDYYVDVLLDRTPHKNRLNYILNNIDNGNWVLYLNDERKRKLKTLMK